LARALGEIEELLSIGVRIKALDEVCNSSWIWKRDVVTISATAVLQMLIHRRITQWAAARGLIPDWQNGFREKYRTNNNPFVLRLRLQPFVFRVWIRAQQKEKVTKHFKTV
jgi:hypothetical protein